MEESLEMRILENLITSISDCHEFENELKASRFIYDATILREMVNGLPNPFLKVSLEVEHLSNAYRAEGNLKFKKADTASITEAVLLYTKAICAAPSKTPALALAHGNRAAALYKLGEFQVAYDDCQCALDLNHPKADLILLRQATSARSMSDAAKFEACIEKVEKLRLADKFPEVNEYRTDLANMNGNAVPDAATSTEFTEKKQKVLKSKRRGRYVVADEPIHCNDVIMTEEAFAFVPILDKNESYWTIRNACDNCAEGHIAAFPCNDCQSAFYCTPRCREQHFPIHSIECNGYKGGFFLLLNFTAKLALRSLLVVFDSLLEKLKNRRKGNTRPLKRAEQLWPHILNTARESMGLFMGLYPDFEAVKHNREIVRYLPNAFLVCSYLTQKSSFFESTRRKRLAIMSSEPEWEIVITALWLRLTNLIRCNAHNIRGLVLEENFFGATFPPGRVYLSISLRSPFLAIYPRMRLYNHSCKTNIRVKFGKAKVHIIATENIDTGKEILDSYGICSLPTRRVEHKSPLEEIFGVNCEQCCNAGVFSYFQYNHIICNGNDCNAAYVPGEADGSKCPVCFKKYDAAFYLGNRLCADFLEQSVDAYIYLLDLYVKMNQYLPRHTKRRFVAGIRILERFVDCDSRCVTSNEIITRRMLTIAVELCETVEQIKGIGSQFLSCAAFVLDILALRKVNGLERINIEFDLMKIKRAMDVLTPRIRRKFENYFDAYTN